MAWHDIQDRRGYAYISFKKGDNHTPKDDWYGALRADLCAYCLGLGGTIDHIVPQSQGGSKTSWLNQTGCCDECNNAKGSEPMVYWLLTREDADARIRELH
jgi:5-methylcytosine-specific restriction endonuclease McrA